MRQIRKKMVEIITRDIVNSNLMEVVNKLLPDSTAKDIEKACQGIYPLHDVYIRKVSKLTYCHHFFCYCNLLCIHIV